MTSKLSHVRGFDGLRGLAVVSVFLEHKVVSGYGLGGLGVWLFFALSGFLIIRILHQQRGRVEGGASTVGSEFMQFWKRRLLRIFPLYYVVLAFITAYLLIKHVDLIAAGLPWYAAYASNFYIAYVSGEWSRFSHLWSLSVEQQFYLFAAPIFLLFPVMMHWRILQLMLACAVMGLLASPWTMHNVFALYLSPLPNFGFMAIGGMLALEGERFSWTPGRWNQLLLAGVAAVCVVILMESASHAGPSVASLKFLLAYFFAFAVIGYVSHRQDSLLTRLLSTRAITYIGTISYGFYIFHLFAPSYAFVSRVLPLDATPTAIRDHWYVAQFLMTVGIASLSWHLLEKPLLRLKGRDLGRRAITPAKSLS